MREARRPLPRPAHGALTAMAKDLGISRRRLGRFFAGLDTFTPAEALAAMQHPAMEPLGLDYADCTGTQIPEGTNLGGGLIAARASRREADEAHAQQLAEHAA